MYSLRDFLWLNFYGGQIPPASLSGLEILYASVVAMILILVGWLLLRRLFFHISENGKSSRITSLVYSVVLALAWLIGSLEWFSLKSMTIMLSLIVLSTLSTLGYLFGVRNKG